MLGLGRPAAAQELLLTTSFSDRQAGHGEDQGTWGYAIDPSGAIGGGYEDANGTTHGLLRTANGRMITIDDPYAAYHGTFLYSINAVGASTGYYYDSSYEYHAFLRSPDGTFTTFAYESIPSWGIAINRAGWIAAAYYSNEDAYESFLRAPDGTMTPFAAPDAGSDYLEGTLSTAINDAGVITGYYVTTDGSTYGFVRATDGTITEFNVSGAADTWSYSINQVGATTGILRGYGRCVSWLPARYGWHHHHL